MHIADAQAFSSLCPDALAVSDSLAALPQKDKQILQEVVRHIDKLDTVLREGAACARIRRDTEVPESALDQEAVGRMGPALLDDENGFVVNGRAKVKDTTGRPPPLHIHLRRADRQVASNDPNPAIRRKLDRDAIVVAVGSYAIAGRGECRLHGRGLV